MLASVEKRALIWLALHMPQWVNSDHLTAIGFLSLAAVGLSYWAHRPALVIVFLILNWFGDSLDGTLARVRDQQRPRYGYYVDHILDACGAVFVFGGLALSGYMSERIAVGLLVAYLLVSIEVYLATHTVGTFHLSFAGFGPTELRLLLIAGNIALLSRPAAPLFDIGGAIGIAGMGIALVWSIAKHAGRLYRAETPRAQKRSPGLLVRWWKFNSVGAAGFVVQLAVLWGLTRLGIHYLLATALAVEIAVLHNFLLHETWTWRGLAIEQRWQRLLRFHIANGFVSVVSNVILTWAFKQWFALPLLVSNALAVVAMALLNFVLAAAWVFRGVEAKPAEPGLLR